MPGIGAADLVAAVDAAVVDRLGVRLVDDDLTDVERAAADRAEAAAGDLPRLGSRRWTTHDATGGASSSVACTASAA